MAVYKTNLSDNTAVDGLGIVVPDASWLMVDGLGAMDSAYINTVESLYYGGATIVNQTPTMIEGYAWGLDHFVVTGNIKADLAGTYNALTYTPDGTGELIEMQGNLEVKLGDRPKLSGSFHTFNYESSALDMLLKGKFGVSAESFTINEFNVTYDDGSSDPSLMMAYKGKVTFSENGIKGTINSLTLNLDGQYIEVSGMKLSAAVLYSSSLSTLLPTILSRNDTITGTGVDGQILDGYGGNDTIIGGEGDDTLIGGAGNDLLNGGMGNDSMEGGTGNDTYVGSAGDSFSEAGGSGTDTIQTDATHTLGEGFEHLILTGSGNINGTGNGLNNNITGNIGNNLLIGAAGVDNLAGGGGDDTYEVNLIQKGRSIKIEDKITEGVSAGTDMLDLTSSTIALSKAATLTLAANFEGLDASGTGATWLNLTGNTLDNTIVGNDAANAINGATGNDTLTGGLGNDQFVFSTALNASTNVDAIEDFTIGADLLVLDNDIFKALGAPGALTLGFLGFGAAAADADDRLVYDGATGHLYYDADDNGVGAQIQFAQLDSGLALTEANFTIIN